MNLTIDLLKSAQQKLGHQWFNDQPNIIGIRSAANVPNVFNDFLAVVYAENGVEMIHSYSITTDPGTFYLQNPLNVNGTAVLKSGQYLKSHSIGFHQQKPDHRALCQTGNLIIFRDNDKDVNAETAGMSEFSGSAFGINIHGANKGITSTAVNKWSAGCQVFANWNEKEALVDICEKFKTITGNKFTYTLINEADLG